MQFWTWIDKLVLYNIAVTPVRCSGQKMFCKKSSLRNYTKVQRKTATPKSLSNKVANLPNCNLNDCYSTMSRLCVKDSENHQRSKKGVKLNAKTCNKLRFTFFWLACIQQRFKNWVMFNKLILYPIKVKCEGT